MKALADKLANNPLQVAVGVGLLLVVGYLLVRKALGDVAAAAGGIVSGNNALTRGTPYEGAGLAGTAGAAANAATGGALQSVGEWLGGTLADARESLTEFFNPSIDSNTFYAVTFPDGARHSINAGAISRSGAFSYGGKSWQLFIDSKGARVARPA